MQETIRLPNGIQLENIKTCDLCDCSDMKFWDSARSNSLYRCAKCGLVFTSPRIKDSVVKDNILYSQAYFKRKSRMTQKLIEARKKTYRAEIDFLMRFVRNGRILDVGCGMGTFLESLGGEWEKHGCDVSSYALEEARKREIKVYRGEFEKIDFGDTQFDVIYFRASLHHAYSPKLCLKKAYKLLKRKGIVAICMSNNCGGLAGKFFKAHIRSYEQAHNYIFSKDTLIRYLHDAEFNVFEINYPYFKTGYGSFMDIAQFFFLYGKYIYLRKSGRLSEPNNYDFASPVLYGNYINVYAQKA